VSSPVLYKSITLFSSGVNSSVGISGFTGILGSLGRTIPFSTSGGLYAIGSTLSTHQV
jgi:hypothetical protein